MHFPEGEPDKFIVGSDDFGVYQCNFHVNGEQQHISQNFYGHTAPVTKVNSHPRASQSEMSAHNEHYSDLILSSSMDWTVKLWSPKCKNDPLYTFENAQEYVYDVQWSPVHPSIFAACDGDGFLEIWDLNKDTEAPIAYKQTLKKTALNCLQWSADGRKIAVGNSDGQVNMWSLDKEVSQPRSEDFTDFEENIQTQLTHFKAN